MFYYADHARKPAEALRIAEMEVARRKDVYTLDAYAWALHVNGRQAEASASMNRALAVGVKDPAVQARAAVISGKATGDVKKAAVAR